MRERLLRFFPFVLIAAAVLLAYGNVYGNAFLFDDEFLIEKNQFLRSITHLGDIFTTGTTAGFGGKDSFFRPLQIFLYLIVFQIFSLSAVAFHALNIGLHAINGCLMFKLGKRTRLSSGPALIASLLWALHPIHTEAVTYMSGTADPLYVLFILAGLLLWDERQVRGRIAALVCFILALLSKEAAIVFPALLTVKLYCGNEKRPKISGILGKTWEIWAIAIFYLIARATFLDFDKSFVFYDTPNAYTQSIWVRILTFFATLPEYLRLLLFPFGLHMERNFPVFIHFFNIPVWIGLPLFASLPILFFLDRRGKTRNLRLPLFGILWFFAALVPLSGIIVPVNALFLEHWMYLPTIGLFLGLIAPAAAFAEKNGRDLAIALVIFAIDGLGFLTFQQNALWRDPVSFYNHILQYEEGSARLHNNLAMAYADEGNDSMAMQHYQKAVVLSDTYAQTHFNLGMLYLKYGNLDDGTLHMKRALALDKNFYHAARKLAEIYRFSGDAELATHYQTLYEQTRPKNIQP